MPPASALAVNLRDAKRRSVTRGSSAQMIRPYARTSGPSAEYVKCRSAAVALAASGYLSTVCNPVIKVAGTVQERREEAGGPEGCAGSSGDGKRPTDELGIG